MSHGSLTARDAPIAGRIDRRRANHFPGATGKEANASRTATPRTLRTNPAVNPEALLVVIALFTALIAMILLQDVVSWDPLTTAFIGLALAAILARRSVLATVHLLGVSLAFGILPGAVGVSGSSAASFLANVWALAFAIGAAALSLRRNLHPRSSYRLTQPGPAHFLVAYLSLAVQAWAVASSQLGVSAQIASGLTTPTGALGFTIIVGPPLTQMILIGAIRARARLLAPMLLAALQTIVLASGGFRGAGILFLVTTGVALAVFRNRLDPRPSRRRNSLLILTGLALAVVTFALGSARKSQVALEAWGDAGQFRLDSNWWHGVAERAQKLTFLDNAIQASVLPGVRDALSWQSQLLALVPRPLWPGKPIIDYGQQVSVHVYGLEYGTSSTTVSAVGDAMINAGLVGVLLVGLLTGAVLAGGERLVAKHQGILGLALSVVLANAALNFESPVILTTAGAMRSLFLLVVVWWIANRLGTKLFGTRPHESSSHWWWQRTETRGGSQTRTGSQTEYQTHPDGLEFTARTPKTPVSDPLVRR